MEHSGRNPLKHVLIVFKRAHKLLSKWFSLIGRCSRNIMIIEKRIHTQHLHIHPHPYQNTFLTQTI